MSTNPSSEYLSVKEAAAHSGKSVSTVRKWIREGKVETKPKEKANSKIFIKRSSLMGFLMTEAEPTIEGSGQSVESIEKDFLQSVDLEEMIQMKVKLQMFESKIEVLESRIEADKHLLSSYQQLLSEAKEEKTAVRNENERIHNELLLIRSAYQDLEEVNRQLITRNNQLMTYISLPWYKKIGSTLLLTDKSETD